METATLETIPLTDDERDWLMTIYRKRLKYLMIAFPGVTFILTAYSFSKFGFAVYSIINDLVFGTKNTWMGNEHLLAGWYYKIEITVVRQNIETRENCPITH